jgi:purine nucleoside permease
MTVTIPIKIVIVTMYEVEAPTDDHFGEFHLWVERLPLPERLPFAHGFRELRYNPEKAALGIVTGVGTARAAASIMALGMDPRFDLTRAYWLVAGIAGVNPHAGSIGSAAWAEWVVDTDLAYEIDAREIPSGWPTGYLPLGKSRPYEPPVNAEGGHEAYRLDPGLVRWAYRLTAAVGLDDTPGLQAARRRYTGFPAAQMPPAVVLGDEVTGSTFWHGALLNQRAIDWMAYWTGGKGRFVMTAMEDTGTLQALTWLGRAGRVDARRALVLRTGSNYSMQPLGVTAAENLAAESAGEYSGYLPALEAAYRVGRVVVDALLAGWERYAGTPPL